MMNSGEPPPTHDIIPAMKAQLEPQNIDAIAQRVVELLKPYLLGRMETTIIPIPSKSKGEYMTVPQLAEYLQISKSTIFSWIYQRKIPYSKIGRRVMFKREDIVQWCEDKKVKASDDDRLR
jgi:excisionase family DNA binding protein